MSNVIYFILKNFYLHYGRVKDKKNNVMDLVIVVLLFIPALIAQGIENSIPVITKYYPFSLLFQEKLSHYKYHKEKSLADFIENKMKKEKKIFFIIGVTKDRYFITFHGYFLKKQKKSVEKTLLTLVKKRLHLGKASVYIRGIEKNEVRILIPIEVIFKK
jgi:hypothetical protein